MSHPKPKVRYGPWPEQAGFMRAEMCCLFLEPILNNVSRDLYIQVRKAVHDWDVGPEAVAETAMRSAAVNARWKKAG